MIDDQTPEDLHNVEDKLKKDTLNGSIAKLTATKLIEKELNKKSRIIADNKLDLLSNDLKKLKQEEVQDLDIPVLSLEDEEELQTQDKQENSTPKKDLNHLDVPTKTLSLEELKMKKTIEDRLNNLDGLVFDNLETKEVKAPRKIRRVFIIEEMKCSLCVNDQLLTYFISSLK